MAVTAYKYPSTAANVDRDGKIDWVNPDNAKTSNNVYAGSAPDKATYGDWLRLTTFGFSSADIPSGATIDGIEVEIDGATDTTNQMNDSALYLRKTSGQTGSNKASATYYTIVEATRTYGGATDKWGATLADTDICSSNFGVDLSVYNTSPDAPGSVAIDCIRIRIYYTIAGWTHIAKVCGVTAANIGKVDGVAVASIAKLLGTTV